VPGKKKPDAKEEDVDKEAELRLEETGFSSTETPWRLCA
jgi:hypothetical protein